jgi:hypothetical protein
MENDVAAELFRGVFDVYLDIITLTPPEQYTGRKQKLKLPVLSSDLVLPLVREATKIFQSEPLVLKLSYPITIVGDLHGHLFDLIRLLHDLGLPPLRSYLFLGDLIDRGAFSTETLILVLLLKVFHPHQVFVIRGNHEFDHVCVSHAEFYSELTTLYASTDFGPTFMDLFAWLPLAAVIDDDAFAVHGAVSPDLIGPFQLEALGRPLRDFEPTAVPTRCRRAGDGGSSMG